MPIHKHYRPVLTVSTQKQERFIEARVARSTQQFNRVGCVFHGHPFFEKTPEAKKTPEGANIWQNRTKNSIRTPVHRTPVRIRTPGGTIRTMCADRIENAVSRCQVAPNRIENAVS